MNKFGYSLGFTSQENEVEKSSLPVEGVIPDWLNGSLIRTAPTKFEVGKDSYRHWFDGLAMLHKFSIKDQQVNYSCKFLKSDAYCRAMEKNRIVYSEFGTDPCRDLFRKVVTFFRGAKSTDNGSVNVLLHANGLTANTETPKPITFDLDSLETKAHLKYKDDLQGQMTSVHPHYNDAGILFSYLTELGSKSKYHIYSQEPGSFVRKLIASIPVKEPAYMHSLGMTENYIILTEFPLMVNPLKFSFNNQAFIEKYDWKPEKGTKINLINKSNGNIRSFKAEAFFAFHHVNAFEQFNEVVFDIIAYRDPGIIDQLYLDKLRSEKLSVTTGELWRFSVNPENDEVSRKLISSTPLELPRINYKKYNARPYSYVYGTGTSVEGNFADNITKINVTNGQNKIWHKPNCYPGEPVFIAHPKAKKEDDGILLSIVLDTENKNSFLLILNAATLEEIARARLSQHITFGFHGQYVPDGNLTQVLSSIHK